MYSVLLLDTPFSILVMLILTVPVFIKGKLSRWQGVLMLAMYAAYCIYQFVG
ncbi:MAG: hypothetical protein K6A38_07395 [Lachnospiraceae bacterium]|nr:hypothetical protein [Lachnospiraceae bacterium]